MCIPFDTTDLDLEGAAVTDLSPLAGLTALRRLGIFETQVTDLSPLAGLTALRRLGIFETPVTDLSPLAGLTNLWKLQVPDGTQYSTRAAIQDAIAAASP
jgi:internalin A